MYFLRNNALNLNKNLTLQMSLSSSRALAGLFNLQRRMLRENSKLPYRALLGCFALVVQSHARRCVIVSKNSHHQKCKIYCVVVSHGVERTFKGMMKDISVYASASNQRSILDFSSKKGRVNGSRGTIKATS